ncbi:MAG TPA: LptA/OstA family protein [Syntrophales bacterium]|nr:LptA/OstA family protein [Syntrophales bacterium]
MKRKPVLILMLLVMAFLILQGTLWGQDTRAKLLKAGESKPIQIVSDRLDAYQEKDLVQFSGNVVATQGERVMQSDVLMVYFKKKSDGKKPENKEAGTDGAAKASDIDRIEAKGNVRITEKDRIVTGEQAILYNEEQKIIVTGNPVMKEGKNVITGDRVVVLLDENRGVVEGAANKRVTATIYPEESKGTKK